MEIIISIRAKNTLAC